MIYIKLDHLKLNKNWSVMVGKNMCFERSSFSYTMIHFLCFLWEDVMTVLIQN